MSASTPYFTSDSLRCNLPDCDTLPDLSFDPSIRVVLCDGEPAEVWSEAGRYYVKPFGSDLPTRFNTFESFKAFEAAHFTDVPEFDTDPTPEPPAAILPFPSVKLLPAYATAAVEAPTTEHVIRIDEMVSECKRCRETFKGDAALCPTCADKQVEILIDPHDQLRALNQQLDAMFTDICTNEAWKAKRKALLQQKSALEAQINSARPQIARGEYYYGMDILAAVKKFEAKYPDRTVTAITINSAYETEITDVKGVPVKMSGAVRPNTVWVGGK